jgi:hypothetical protein
VTRETKSNIGPVIGAGVAFALLGTMLIVLDRSQRAAAQPPAKGGGGTTGKGGGPTQVDPWASLKTQLQLLELQTNSLAALSSYILPSVHQIGLDSDAVKAAGQAIAFGKTPPPATSDQLVPLGQAVGKLLADAPAASTFDAATQQTVSAIVATANGVLAAAISTLPGGHPGVAGWSSGGAGRGGSISQGGPHGGGFNTNPTSRSAAQSNGGPVSRSAAQNNGGGPRASSAQRQAEAQLIFMLNPPRPPPPR